MQRFSPRFRSMQFFDVRDNVWNFLWSRHACGCQNQQLSQWVVASAGSLLRNFLF